MPALAPTSSQTSLRPCRSVAIWGAGILVMLADCDAGNVLVAAQAGALWGLSVVPVFICLIPALYWIQQLSVRVGVRTGKGFGELVRERLGPLWSALTALCLTATVLATIITQFTAIAGVGQLLGIQKSVAILTAATIVIAVCVTGRGNIFQTAVILVGLLETSFLVMGYLSQLSMDRAVFRRMISLPVDGLDFSYWVMAILGATFSPWMIFYHQKAASLSDRSSRFLRSSWIETISGAILAQAFTVAIVFVVVAGSRPHAGGFRGFDEIVLAFINVAGERFGVGLFVAGTLSSAFIASIVSAVALSEGVFELLPGVFCQLDRHGGIACDLRATALLVTASGFIAYFFPDPVKDSIVAQVLSCAFSIAVVGMLLVISVGASSVHCTREKESIVTP